MAEPLSSRRRRRPRGEVPTDPLDRLGHRMWPWALGLSVAATAVVGSAALTTYVREEPLTVERARVVELRVIDPHGGCGRGVPGSRAFVTFVDPTPPRGLPSEFSIEDCVTYRTGQTVEVMRDGVGPSHVILHAKRPLGQVVLILAATAVGSFVAFFVLGVTRAVSREAIREARSRAR